MPTSIHLLIEANSVVAQQRGGETISKIKSMLADIEAKMWEAFHHSLPHFRLESQTTRSTEGKTEDRVDNNKRCVMSRKKLIIRNHAKFVLFNVIIILHVLLRGQFWCRHRFQHTTELLEIRLLLCNFEY